MPERICQDPCEGSKDEIPQYHEEAWYSLGTCIEANLLTAQAMMLSTRDSGKVLEASQDRGLQECPASKPSQV